MNILSEKVDIIFLQLADTNDKAQRMSKSLPADDDSKSKKIAFAAVDTLLWQAFASVIIPGFTINRICALSLYTMGRAIPNVSWVLLIQFDSF